jgi:hypothetical protein
MTLVAKLQIEYKENNEVFEKGKNGIQTIRIDKPDKIIEIQYEDDLEWNTRIIPFNGVRSFQFQRLKMKLELF